MSTSLLYHTCGIRGYEYRSTEYVWGTTVVHIEQPRVKLRCPHCGRGKCRSGEGACLSQHSDREQAGGDRPGSCSRLLREVQCEPARAGRLRGRIPPAHAGACRLYQHLLPSAHPYYLLPYDVIPLVNSMNAVSRLISSSLNMVNRWPAPTNRVGNSL